MDGKLLGKIAFVTKAETAETALSAAEALRDFEPSITRGPGRKLGL